LAWCSPDEEVDAPIGVNRVSCVNEIGEVAIVRDLRVVMREDRAGKGIDLAEPRRLPPELVPSDGSRLDA
jgi:hypothetical protein